MEFSRIARMDSETIRPSEIKAAELEKRYNEEVRVRKEAENPLGGLQLQAQALEQKYAKEMRRLRKETQRLFNIEYWERKVKLELELKTLENKHDNMPSKAKELNGSALIGERQKLESYNRVITSLEKALTRETQMIKLEITKGQVESCIRQTDAMRQERDNALSLVQEMKTKQKRETDAMRKERDNALRLVQEIRTKQKRETDADAMRQERDNVLSLMAEIVTEQKRETDAMRKERDNALRSVEEIRTKQKRETDAMRQERDNALSLMAEIATEQKRETDAMQEERDNALRLVEEIRTKQMEQGQPPRSFTCPISQEVMQEPHFTADGHTYEANAIRTWFATGHHTSPLTNLKLSHRNLVPNHALRSAIQEFKCFSKVEPAETPKKENKLVPQSNF